MTRFPKPGHTLAAIWPAAVGTLAVFYAAIGDGAPTRRSAIAWMMGSWGARLAVQASYARVPDLPPVASYPRLLTLALFFSTPALFASLNPEPSLTVVELGAAALWVLAFAGETTADRGRLGFVRRPHAVCEALIWTAFALFASASPWGWLAFACPVARLYLLRRRY